MIHINSMRRTHVYLVYKVLRGKVAQVAESPKVCLGR